MIYFDSDMSKSINTVVYFDVLTSKLQTSFFNEFMYSYRTVVPTNIKMPVLFLLYFFRNKYLRRNLYIRLRIMLHTVYVTRIILRPLSALLWSQFMLPMETSVTFIGACADISKCYPSFLTRDKILISANPW
jgi:hypothetical protein